MPLTAISLLRLFGMIRRLRERPAVNNRVRAHPFIPNKVMDDSKGIPEKSKIGNADDFKISRMKPKIKSTNPHKHREYHEIIYLTKGAGFHTIDLSTYRIEPPMIFLVKAGEVHFWEFTEIPEGHVVLFKPGFLAHFSSQAVSSLFDRIPDRRFLLRESPGFPFGELFGLMETEFTNARGPSTRIVASSLELVLAQMHRLPERREQEARTDAHRQILRRFRQLIDRHLTDYHLVRDYAALLHITPKYLNEIARQKTGKTASGMIAEARILEAQRQLLHSTQNVSGIAHHLGFSSPSHFIRYFKKRTGTTPEQYRRAKVTDVLSSP